MVLRWKRGTSEAAAQHRRQRKKTRRPTNSNLALKLNTLIYRCGNNYGWRTLEGSRCNDGYDGADCSVDVDPTGYAFPTFEYCHFDYDSSSEAVDICGDRTITGLSIIGEYTGR